MPMTYPVKTGSRQLELRGRVIAGVLA